MAERRKTRTVTRGNRGQKVFGKKYDLGSGEGLFGVKKMQFGVPNQGKRIQRKAMVEFNLTTMSGKPVRKGKTVFGKLPKSAYGGRHRA